jgi:hypothetical protein
MSWFVGSPARKYTRNFYKNASIFAFVTRDDLTQRYDLKGSMDMAIAAFRWGHAERGYRRMSYGWKSALQ